VSDDRGVFLMLTVLEIIKRTTEFFAARGIESPRLNAELLIGHALGLKRMQLYLQFERPLTEPELETLRPLVRRRGQHEPVQYIIGETDFHGLKLKVDRRALIPRPETEQLVEHVIAACTSPPARIVDLGTGTGAIALALAAAFPAASITAVDRSEKVLALAAENAAKAGVAERVAFVRSNWLDALDGTPFDVVVSNPPYLSAAEVAATAPEVRGFEPTTALLAGEDGLADLRLIISATPAHLAAGGLLALETGVTQHAALRTALEAAGFKTTESRRDLAGHDRFLLARR
jgi:release factor glutamine methyltransferase